jgi:hypothetical protein
MYVVIAVRLAAESQRRCLRLDGVPGPGAESLRHVAAPEAAGVKDVAFLHDGAGAKIAEPAVFVHQVLVVHSSQHSDFAFSHDGPSYNNVKSPCSDRITGDPFSLVYRNFQLWYTAMRRFSRRGL